MIDRMIQLCRKLNGTIRNIFVAILALVISIYTLHILTFPAIAFSRSTGETDPGIVTGEQVSDPDGSFDNGTETVSSSVSEPQDGEEPAPAEVPDTAGAPAVTADETPAPAPDSGTEPAEPQTPAEDPDEITAPAPEDNALPAEDPAPEPGEEPAPVEDPATEPVETPASDADPAVIADAASEPAEAPEETPSAEDEKTEPEEESDPEADTETAETWNEMFRNAELTGVWADDLITLAELQIGYRESTKNFIRDEEGRKYGYTRYGEWYGDPYAEWDSLFVMFNLYHAGITADVFPYCADCEEWINALKNAQLFREGDGFVPEKGDLVFADTDEDGRADHAAIVKAVERDAADNPDQLIVIEGDTDNEVRESRYEFFNPLITGFAQLPENPQMITEEPEAEPQILSFTGSANRVDVTVFYEEGAFPEGTVMQVKAVWDRPVIEAIHETVKEDNKEVVRVQAVDITFYDAEGNEIEPSKPIRVTMKSNAVPEEATEKPVVVHVDNEMGTSVVETDETQEEPSGSAESVTFEAGSFSVYAIVYTVDFHYEIDGRQYEFRLPGGGYVSFTKLAEILGIGSAADQNPDAGMNAAEGNTEYGKAETAFTLDDVTVSDSTREFVRGVTEISFSNPELLYVTHVQEEIKVGTLKETRNLKCEYSGDLTKRQIGKINEQTVEAGDWALISLKPFDSEETLTVTMDDGEVFTVRVTDGQLKTRMISSSGETWEITVTYGEDAGIPEDAELYVKEITEADEAYSEIQRNITENLTEGRENIPFRPILFDISIRSGGEEIEPAEGSEVLVEVKLAGNAAKGVYSGADSPVLINDLPVNETQAEMEKQVQVIHLSDQNTVDVMETEDTINEREAVSSFITPSFSNWLLYLDEDLTGIEVTTGDSLTLRPYSEWIWKQNDEPAQYQGGEWMFPASEWDTWREGSETMYRHKTNGSLFRSFEKTDSQLNETYTVVTSVSLSAGTFDLQTNKGKTIHVNVRQGQASGKPDTVDGVQGLTVNLFDYDVPVNGGNYDFTRSGALDVQSNVASNPDNSNNINTGHDLKFLGYGGSNVGETDTWFWINNYTQDVPQQGIVKQNLVNGYPELTPGRNGQERSNPGLGYLFDPNSHNSNVYAFPNADGLFRQDNLGYYYYNSNANYAEYDRRTNRFILYEHTYSQNTGGSEGANAKPIGFFPFHEYDTVDTQPEMNFNRNLNHHFGMSMTVDFELPSGKQIADSDGNMHDIIYEFSGDDDLWVFIDDELVLDIGGIHQPVTGTINFTTGQIKIHGVDDITKTFEVGGHTLKMFYMERGGCDSNLSVRFNLPLTRGNGRVRAAKKSRTDDSTSPDQYLPGAVFGIWENAACTGEPYKTAITDAGGIADFGDLPVKEEGQTYYLKEIVPPEGYRINNTVYTVTENGTGSDGKYIFVVKQGDTPVETEQNVPVVRDDRPDPISLTVQKKWKNADDTDMNPPDQRAVFELKRYKTEVKYDIATTCDLNIYRVDQNWSNPRHMVTKTYAGNTAAYVNWTYNQYVWDGWKNWQYRVNNGNTQTKQETSPAQIALPSNGAVNVYIFDGNLGGQYEQYGVENITVTGTEGSSQADMEISEKVIDTGFSRELTLPTASGAWSASFEHLPVQETVNNSTFYYEYFIEEKTVPEGFEAVYLDFTGKPTADPSGLSTNVTGSQTIVNRRLLDIPLEKQWADFSGDAYSWQAVFQLEQMEVKVNESDPDAPDVIDHFTAIEGKTLRAEKNQTPPPQFTGLPMYRVHNNGTVYRILYSVEEIAYTVSRGDTVVAQWSKDGSLDVIGDVRYEPQFEQDAGEHGSEIDDYQIRIVNMLHNHVLDKEIDLSLVKTWPEGTDYAARSDAFASFVLKRYVHEEYRDYSRVPADAEWVTITMRTSNNDTGGQEVIVPIGTTVHILGNIKPQTNANKIVFSQSTGGTVELVRNNPSGNLFPFDIEVTADQTKTLTLIQGDNYVAGGRAGFRLADYNNRTPDEQDSSFSEAFTLNPANRWTASFAYLPAIEEQNIDPKTGSQTIYVFSYYLEETGSNPKGFTPVFKDNTDTIIGADSANRIDYSVALTANNIPVTADITLEKVDEDQLDAENPQTLIGAAFRIEKYTSAQYTQKDISWGENGERSLPDTDRDGLFALEGLPAGYYRIVETVYPKGYIRLSSEPLFELRVNGVSGQLEVILLNPDGTDAEENRLEEVRVNGLTIRYGNRSGAALPKTGGPGTGLFVLPGGILVFAAGYLLRRRMHPD